MLRPAWTKMRQLGRGAGVEGGLVSSFNHGDDDDDIYISKTKE